MHEITFTMDVEDPRPNNTLEQRYSSVTHQVLDFLQELGIKGTFFCVGEIARESPCLIKEISNRGHEVALHSLAHTPLVLQEPKVFREETILAKNLLEDITQQSVIGYRAPIFSLTKKSRWATEVLSELGFAYSSSVLPAANPLFGYPEAPSHPFQWPSGLIEIPAPIAFLGGMKMPYLGGIYLRYLPTMLIKSQITKTKLNNGLWCYCHPYDFDDKQPFYQMKGASTLVSVLLWLNRKGSYNKIKRVFKESKDVSAAMPFRQQLINQQYNNLPIFYDSVIA